MQKSFLSVGVLLAMYLMLTVSCEKNVKRPKPTEVVYQEIIQEDDSQKVQRTCYYTIDSVRYDTIQKRVKSTIETTDSREYKNLPKDAVDLNTIFADESGETDFNFTELNEHEWEYLEKIGIYWDDDYGCYRKREKKH